MKSYADTHDADKGQRRREGAQCSDRFHWLDRAGRSGRHHRCTCIPGWCWALCSVGADLGRLISASYFNGTVPVAEISSARYGYRKDKPWKGRTWDTRSQRWWTL